MKQSFQNSFTLIELLVVISILGLLSSLVLLSLQGAKDQADISKAMESSHVTRVTLGINLVGEWRLDEGLGIDVKDSSGYDNHGILGNGLCTPGNGTCPAWANGVFNKALEFDGIDDYVSCGEDKNLDISEEITVSGWYYLFSDPNVDGNNTYRGMVRKGSNYRVLLEENREVSCSVYIGTVRQKVDSLNCGGNYLMPIGQWQYVVFTYDGAIGNGRIYLNGELETSCNYAVGNFDLNNDSVIIGRDGSTIPTWPGIIDEIQIYDRILSTTEIQQQYVQGAIEHGVVLK